MVLPKIAGTFLSFLIISGCSAAENPQSPETGKQQSLVIDQDTALPDNRIADNAPAVSGKAAPAEATAKPNANIYTCNFPTAGKVLIDTTPNSSSITYKGVTYPASSGSYFYQSDNGAIAAMFTPDKSEWGLMGEGIAEEPNVKCTSGG
ncbi:MAG: hypothetical protein HC843_03600 [Sphingomonadales bacterium]|nr:hypothetical protein [Sphingomonadales bacterium]